MSDPGASTILLLSNITFDLFGSCSNIPATEFNKILDSS